ncbi:hypothetical protein MMC16_007487 [Acarospora aff. strigata]|nr:hypothetical protein [Acarospora aff. strigata]
MATNGATWQEIAHEVQTHRESTITQIHPPIPEVPSEIPTNVTNIPLALLTTREVDITSKSPEDLVASLATGSLTSHEVTSAFLRRAGLAQRLTNCITELLPGRALKRAKELDNYLRESKKPLGPLHGLPISVKEHIGMKGLDLNAGFVAWVGKKAEDDALVLKILWDAGCVFYVRTTEPQLLMHLETSSNLFGVTVNPFNRSLTSGGSSGGEGALIGLRGSCLGVGSDIGGSIRSPAAHNGLFGLRPTSLRVPSVGISAERIGSGYIDGTLGPLSTSLSGIKMFMKIVLAAKPWLIDPNLVPLPWRDQKSYLGDIGPKRLRVAILWSDGVVQPHPPVTRALKEVVQKLRKVEGVEITEWQPHKHELAWEVIASLYYMDGGDECRKLLEASGEPWLPLSRFICSESPYVKHRSVAEIQDLKSERDKYRREYAQHWNSTATSVAEGKNLNGMVDVILCPASPGVAPPLDTSRYWGYTSQWNLLDYPAVVFPVTTVDPVLDGRDDGYVPKNEKDQYNHGLYNGPEGLVGVPVSLQLVARRYEDEKVRFQ